MTNEDYKRRYLHLLAKVKLMRGYQREWDKTKALSQLERQKKKALEWDVDSTIKKEDALLKSQQQDIF
jgi:hypothetical protein